ncbi:MAG: tRNA (adenosine(37)-N6)-dimethylallyltransferase MiaA [Candidatus Melainabacteria bacterium]
MPHAASNPPAIVAVVGTTASGKTRLGVALAQALGGEVISADSQLVYRELNIGTAKPTPGETAGIPHHLIDCVPPTEPYTVARYRTEASGVLRSLLAAGKTAVVVGGTGLYIRALLQEEFFPDVPPDAEFRAGMKALADREGAQALHARLQTADPERAAALHPNDVVRVIRALEIIHHTGGPVPTRRQGLQLPGVIHWVGLHYEDRDRMRAVMDERIEAMLAAGWLAEVQALMHRYGADPPAHALTVAHGYPEWVKHLRGELDFEAARDQIRINIHQYGRRQLTFFRPNPAIHWLAVDSCHSPGGFTKLLNASMAGMAAV